MNKLKIIIYSLLLIFLAACQVSEPVIEEVSFEYSFSEDLKSVQISEVCDININKFFMGTDNLQKIASQTFFSLDSKPYQVDSMIYFPVELGPGGPIGINNYGSIVLNPTRREYTFEPNDKDYNSQVVNVCYPANTISCDSPIASSEKCFYYGLPLDFDPEKDNYYAYTSLDEDDFYVLDYIVLSTYGMNRCSIGLRDVAPDLHDPNYFISKEGSVFSLNQNEWVKLKQTQDQNFPTSVLLNLYRDTSYKIAIIGYNYNTNYLSFDYKCNDEGVNPPCSVTDKLVECNIVLNEGLPSDRITGTGAGKI